MAQPVTRNQPRGTGLDTALVPWVGNLQVQRVLTIGMFACIAWALARLLVVAGATATHARAVFLLTTAIFAAGVTLGGRPEGRNYRRYADYGLVDWALLLVPILFLLKLLPRLLEGPAAAGAEVASWMDTPARFFDTTLVWSLFLVLLVWDGSLQVAQALSQLSFQPGEAPPLSTSPAYDDWLSSPYRFVSHTGAWRSVTRSFIGGGFALLVLTGLAVVPPDQLVNSNRPEVLGAIPSVLVYYLLGLLLASQTSLDRLRTDWLRGGAAVQAGLPRRWLAYGLALVGASLVLALLLPTSFSDQAADQLPLIWRWLWPVTLPLRWVFSIVFGVIAWLFAQLAALLLAPITALLPQGSEYNAPLSPAPAPPIAGPPLDQAAAGFPSLASRLAWGFLLYVLPCTLAAYAIWNTWQKRHALWDGLRGGWRDVSILLWSALLDLVATLWRFFGAASPRLRSLAPPVIQARWKQRRTLDGDLPGASGWLRLRGLGPRELIQYFYVSLVQRAEAVGWGRRNGQTPYEFSRELAARLPERRPELESLTEAFVRAKYSRRPVGEDDAQRARGPWERLRGALQTRRRTRRVANWFGLGKAEG